MYDWIFTAVVWACFIYILWFAFADDILSRIAPKLAAKRRLKQAARFERLMERSRERRARKADRVVEWAKRHPDSDVARSILNQQYDDNPEARLRLHQRFEEEYERNREAREAEYEQRAREEMEWALAHPESDVAQRHLRGALDRAQRDLELATWWVNHHQSRLKSDYLSSEDVDDYKSRLADAMTDLDKAEAAVLEIEMALGVDALTEQE